MEFSASAMFKRSPVSRLYAKPGNQLIPVAETETSLSPFTPREGDLRISNCLALPMVNEKLFPASITAQRVHFDLSGVSTTSILEMPVLVVSDGDKVISGSPTLDHFGPYGSFEHNL